LLNPGFTLTKKEEETKMMWLWQDYVERKALRTKLRVKRKSGFWNGALIGFMIGSLLGILVAWFFYPDDAGKYFPRGIGAAFAGLTLGILSAVVGGVIAAIKGGSPGMSPNLKNSG
jgi:hypothetical protein